MPGRGLTRFGRRTPGSPGRADNARYQPSDTPGLALWLKADAGLYQDAAGTTPATADGDPVGLWQDQSGNNYHVSQSTDGKRPLLKIGANGINSRPALLFSVPSAQILTRTVADWLSADTAGTIFVVYRLVDGFSTDAVLLGSADTATATRYFLVALTTNTDQRVRITQRNGDTADVVYGNTALAADDTYLLTARSSGTTYTLRVDGVDQTLTVASGANNGDWLADVTARDNLTIGGLKTNVEGWYLTGMIAEVIVYDGNLTGAALSNVENYLEQRWGF